MLLQRRLRNSGLVPTPPNTLPLEQRVEAALGAYRRLMLDEARAVGPLAGGFERLSQALRTEKTEHLDEPDFPVAEKEAMVRALHFMNRALRSYARFSKRIMPLAREVATRHGRPARILELASGAGFLAIELALHAAAEGLQCEITGSDYVPEYVEQARREASRRGANARFIVLDALRTMDLPVGSFDIVLIAQSMHHFSGGALARMMAEAARYATTSFIGIDGYRSLRNLLFVPGVALPTMRRSFVHDAWLTARKLYPEGELELIASLAAPSARVSVDHRMLGFSIMEVRYDRSRG